MLNLHLNAKRLNPFLGNGYKVIASYGHFTRLDDLKQIDFENYGIKYKLDKSSVISNMKKHAKEANEIVIASDDDREGEAIGYLICHYLKLNVKTTKRIVFQEITKSALLKALSNPTTLNMDRVFSQQSRQILDIYLGYKISPVLWKHIQNKISAGRCQTPALRLIYDNQKLFDNQVIETHYQIKGNFFEKDICFTGAYNIPKNNIFELLDHETIHNDWQLQCLPSREVREAPPKILITSTLQQKASQVLHFSPKATMNYAQELYENGLITYMRTDSKKYSQEFVDTLKRHIVKQYGDEYMNHKIDALSVKQTKNPGTKTQDAHEGIRVCDLNKTEPTTKTPYALKLYHMIYKHTIQSGMSDAIFDDKSYRITNGFMLNDETKQNEKKQKEFYYQYTDRVVKFMGWKIIGNYVSKLSIRTYLDHIDTKKAVGMNRIFAEEIMKGSLVHYSESSLIAQLEKMNIGRPSTFSSILDSIITRKYAQKQIFQEQF